MYVIDADIYSMENTVEKLVPYFLASNIITILLELILYHFIIAQIFFPSPVLLFFWLSIPETMLRIFLCISDCWALPKRFQVKILKMETDTDLNWNRC